MMKPMKYFFLIPFMLFVLDSYAQETNSQVSTSSFGQKEGNLIVSDQQTKQERVDFLMKVAQAYVDNDEFDEAVSAYERVLELEPNHLKAKYILGFVYISAQKYAKAEQGLKELLAEYPDDFKLWNNLAWLYATAKNPAYRDGEKALRCARKALVLAPNDHHVWSTLSEAYYVNAEYKKAYRSIKHMAIVATKYAEGLRKESFEAYKKQINKCRRALETYNALNGIEEEVD